MGWGGVTGLGLSPRFYHFLVAPLNHLLEIRKMWPTNSWHGNVPKAHFFPPILRMTGPLRILLAIIRKGEGGCTCKWMINIKQMNFKMILYLPAEIKCAMVRRWLAVQKIFWFFSPGFTHRAARSQGEVGLVVKILREQICQDSLSWCAEANQLPHMFPMFKKFPSTA